MSLLVVLLFLLIGLLDYFFLSLCWNVYLHVPVALRGPHRSPMKVAAILGSGGHTSEMLRAIAALPSAYWHDNRPFYIVSASDAHSRQLAQQQEQLHFHRRAILYTIPRAREVGQSYSSSVFTTIKAVIASLRIILAEKPDVLLTNGPGVCVPVVAAALLVATCAPWWYSRPVIVYMESFTCVSHLSLTGRLLTPVLADVVTVHWQRLDAVVAKKQRRLRAVRLVYIGCENRDAEPAPPLALAEEQAKYAVVTVGTTKFVALVEAMLQPDLCASLSTKYGLERLYVQYGTGDLPASLKEEGAAAAGDTVRFTCGGLAVEAFRYRPNLTALMSTATLIITHAGAGTILEGLQAARPMIVVPNRLLMSDHQLELAEGLAAGHYLFSLSVRELAEKLPELDISTLRRHAGMDVEQLKEALRPALTGVMEPRRKLKGE